MVGKPGNTGKNLIFMCLLGSSVPFWIIYFVCCLFCKRQSEQLEAVWQVDNPKAQNGYSNSQADQTGAKADHDFCTNNTWYKDIFYY